MPQVLYISQTTQAMDDISDGWTFDEMAKHYPDCVETVLDHQRPSWGCAFYVCGEAGLPVIWRENFDSSD